MSDSLVEILNLTKVFDPKQPPALDNITASFPKGEIIGLVGPDGAGKTTLIRLLAGLLKPTSGEIRVAGHDSIRDAEYIHAMTGYMPQKFGLYEDLTVLQNLNLYADLRNVLGEEKVETFKRLLDFTNLGSFTSRLAGNLSGGMKQKLGLACSLIRKPELLLLDEPSVGVDPISRRELWKMVQDLLAQGITVLWSTAYLDEAERCHTTLLLHEGKLLYHGPPGELTKRVQGRTFKLTNIQGDRRMVLEHVLNEKNIEDGIIQGDDVRIVTRKKDIPIDVQTITGGIKAEICPVSPRFEDAFIDILGGGPGGSSLLAKEMPPVRNARKNVIETKGLTKKFGDFIAADNVSFDIRPGEIFGLLGPNGAGKSTIFKMMCGLLKPTSGEAYVNGLDLQKAPSEARSHVGYMAQKFSLYGDLTVSQNLNFFSGVYNMRGKMKRDSLEQMIKIFGFKEYLNEAASRLPLGFKQRLALSCAVMHHPDILFLDEPTSGVDPITRREFWNHINGLVGKGVTVMVTTHFMDEAEYCDRLGLIYRGKIINTGTPDALKEKARTKNNLFPTLEDAFIQLIEKFDMDNNVS